MYGFHGGGGALLANLPQVLLDLITGQLVDRLPVKPLGFRYSRMMSS
jgi:hypothetical protein